MSHDFPVSNPGSASVPDWEHDFAEAIRSRQIQAAKVAIFLGLKARPEHPPGVLERIALNDAIHLLRTLRSEGIRPEGDDDRYEDDSSEEPLVTKGRG